MTDEPAPRTEEVPVCDGCGSPESDHVCAARDRIHGLPGVFGVVRCRGCGLVRLSPRPVISGLGFYYPETYEAYSAPPAASGRGSLALRARDALRSGALASLGYDSPANPVLRAATGRSRFLRRFGAYRAAGFPAWPGGAPGTRKALEVGCGSGHFLALLEENGWDVVGLDFSADAAAAARKFYDIEVKIGQLGDDPFEPQSFDFIHMRHVIEHVPAPSEALARVFDLLRPGGTVYIETPNVDGTGFARYGNQWFPLEAPRHLWLFGPETLSDAVSKAGLHVTDVRTSRYIAPAWAAAFREQDRLDLDAQPDPTVPAAEKARVRKETLEDITAYARDRMSGDILGVWATRSR